MQNLFSNLTHDGLQTHYANILSSFYHHHHPVGLGKGRKASEGRRAKKKMHVGRQEHHLMRQDSVVHVAMSMTSSSFKVKACNISITTTAGSALTW
jgi:hypothetical protein